MNPALYVGLVVEYERGWGARPDGWLVATTKDAFATKAQHIHNCGDYECFYRIDATPEIKFVTREFYDRVVNAEGLALWTGDRTETWMVTI